MCGNVRFQNAMCKDCKIIYIVVPLTSLFAKIYGLEFSSWHASNSVDFEGKCTRYYNIIEEAQNSKLQPVHGVMIGDANNPGKNGLGDRVRGLVSTAILAAALKRPFKFAIKPSVWHDGSFRFYTLTQSVIFLYETFVHVFKTTHNG